MKVFKDCRAMVCIPPAFEKIVLFTVSNPVRTLTGISGSTQAEHSHGVSAQVRPRNQAKAVFMHACVPESLLSARPLNRHARCDGAVDVQASVSPSVSVSSSVTTTRLGSGPPVVQHHQKKLSWVIASVREREAENKPQLISVMKQSLIFVLDGNLRV